MHKFRLKYGGIPCASLSLSGTLPKLQSRGSHTVEPCQSESLTIFLTQWVGNLLFCLDRFHLGGAQTFKPSEALPWTHSGIWSLSTPEMRPLVEDQRRKKESEAQSSPTLCDPVDCSPPGFSVHGILQARIQEWVTISFSRGPSQPRDRTRVFHIGGRRFNL